MYIYARNEKRIFTRSLLHPLKVQDSLRHEEDNSYINDFHNVFWNDFVISEQRANYNDVNRHIKVCLSL